MKSRVFFAHVKQIELKLILCYNKVIDKQEFDGAYNGKEIIRNEFGRALVVVPNLLRRT